MEEERRRVQTCHPVAGKAGGPRTAKVAPGEAEQTAAVEAEKIVEGASQVPGQEVQRDQKSWNWLYATAVSRMDSRAGQREPGQRTWQQ